MATINENRILYPIAEAPLVSVARATAIAADDTAGTFDVVIELPTGATIKTFAVDYRSATGVLKNIAVTRVDGTFTIADDGVTTVIAVGDIVQITAYYDYN